MNETSFPKRPLRDRIDIVGRHVQITPAMKEYAIEKLEKLDRFHHHGMQILSIHVVMDIVHLQHEIHATVHFGHFTIRASATSNDMYASIDLVMDKIHMQFAKWKERMAAYHHKKKSSIDMPVQVVECPICSSDEIAEFNAEIEEQNQQREERQHAVVTGRRVVHLKELTREEALMKMELSRDAFLVYRSEEDRRLKVLYRRKDGNYGIIEPE